MNKVLENSINFRENNEKNEKKGVYPRRYRDVPTEGSFIWPNPTNGWLNIELPTSNKATILIINSMGQVYFANQNLDNTQRYFIDLTAATKGVYLVKIEQDGRVWTKMIVKN